MTTITSCHCIYMTAMKCINEEKLLLAITISATFPAPKTTVLTRLSTNSSHEHAMCC